MFKRLTCLYLLYYRYAIINKNGGLNMCVNTGRNIETTADDYFLSLYEKDVKDYLELDEFMKYDIKELCFNYKEDTVDIYKEDSLYFNGIHIFTRNNSGKLNFYNDFFIKTSQITQDWANGGIFFDISGYNIRLVNIRKFLLIEKEKQELEKIMSNNNENKKRRL